MISKRINNIVYALILVFFTACTSDDSVETNNAIDAHVLVFNSMPFNATLKIKSTSFLTVSIDVYNEDSSELIWTYSNVEINDEPKNIVIGNLRELKSYHYKIRHDQEVLFKGNFTMLESPGWIADSSSFNVSGELILDGKSMLFNKMSMPSGVFVVDENGKTLWARSSDNFIKMVKLTHRETILTLEDNTGNQLGSGNIILETTFSGDTLTYLKQGVNDFKHMAHHDVLLNNQGNFAYINDIPKDNNYVVDGVSVLNPNGQKIWEWETTPYISIPTLNNNEFVQPWGNSLTIDESDDNYIVSFRNLNQIWKVHSLTGDVIWSIGKEGTILLEGNDAFMFQHHAQMVSDNKLLLFDNGSLEDRSYSRIVVYTIDFDNNEASLTTNIKLSNTLFSPFMGAVQLLPNGFLVTSSMTGKIARLNNNGEVLGQLDFSDRIFRASIIENYFE
ncbi:aryl-sulfate sulfotransferase [Flavivirga spongiicola]|uniref:Aryl-sulfate sulfotransferase n=1 Tax=Flavivirga spongiicola TaxID=421621 RepID=A0ABU7XLD3_9FLAO|nr:aryl-sulfate sulfotransferase [Flavivirga sp. MEBiC05379]MDO5981223.1 aryl-sulfate sulfotransferase [Flavivirga sp. MEBiC05379]